MNKIYRIGFLVRTSSKKLTTGLACLFLTMRALAHVPVKDSLVILKGHLPSSYDQSKIQLFYFSDKGRVKDSAVIHDGSFEIRNYIHGIYKAFLSVDRLGEKGIKTNGDYKTVYLEPGQTFIITGADWKDITITGGPAQTDWTALDKMTVSVTRELEAVSTEKWNKSGAGDATAAKALEEKERTLRIRQHQLQDQFIKEHPASWVSWDIVQERSQWMIDDDGLLAVFNRLDAKYRNTPAGASAEIRIVGGVNAGVGKTAPDFTAMDTLGRNITLSSLRGQYVLVDFWASWCGFCRAETPNIKKAWDKFKDKGLSIVSVSYDDSKDKWMQAIHEDKMPWLQISELKDMLHAPSAKKYGLIGIPMIILLDPTGKIVARNLRGEELQRKVAEALDGGGTHGTARRNL